MEFWRTHPALFFGLCLYVGIALGTGLTFWVVLLLIPLWAGWRWSALGLTVALVGFVWVVGRHQLPSCPPEGLSGEAVVSIRTSVVRSSFFGKTRVLSGQIEEFWVDSKRIGRRIPIRMYLPLRRPSPQVGGAYHIQAKLKQSDRGHYLLKVPPKAVWQRQGGLSWMPQVRAWAKDSLRSRLGERLGQGPPLQLLAGLATGEFGDPEICLGFGRLGLAHLMAISGFHFSLIAAVLLFGLRVWLFPRSVAVVLALLLAMYFLFLGPTPSVLRACIMALLGCLALFFGQKEVALNSLGVALVVALFWDPLAVRTLGFQFSFACTASLLAFSLPLEKRLGGRPFWRGVAVVIAVNLAALPLTLAHFHRFPCIGVITNLLFPAAIGGLIVLVGLALVIEGSFPILGGVSFWPAKMVATAVLWAVRESPSFFDVTLRVPGIPACLLALWGTGLLACTVWNPAVYPQKHGQTRTKPLLRRDRVFQGAPPA